MAIRSVSIQGFRSVRNISLPLSQLNIISGPNGSGKSNLYKAVRLLHEAAIAPSAIFSWIKKQGKRLLFSFARRNKCSRSGA